jgi:dCMP deaminase
LKKKGFFYHSLSDVIREELASEGRGVTREAMIAKGNALRAEFGPGVLAAKTISRMLKDRNYVIDSIRVPAEVNELRKLPNFFLVRVEAPLEMRFARMKARARESDPKTLEAFKEIEDRELKNRDEAKQNIFVCESMADKVLQNNGVLNALHDCIDALLAGLSGEFKLERPSWDDYFMNIARTVATRSNCIKRHVASVIVRDKRIISTGYNGTPRGVKNCNEGGCPRCNNFTDAGTKLDECLCSHGEENAIVQAAYHGVSLKGAVLYTTFSPCLWCAKMIINAGIAEVVYNADYALAETAAKMLREAGVVLREHKYASAREHIYST